MKNNFRVLLAKQRRSIDDVHKGTGLSKTTLTALFYERLKKPTAPTLIKIANFLSVTIDDLLTPEE
ncbi:helix-turn-helix transcriptional regulator [Aerococcaceae bacterium NML190938]|nr:helix-turn-helix transcriptional regulator [Aerococcaceae bacterium NML190938]